MPWRGQCHRTSDNGTNMRNNWNDESKCRSIRIIISLSYPEKNVKLNRNHSRHLWCFSLSRIAKSTRNVLLRSRNGSEKENEKFVSSFVSSNMEALVGPIKPSQVNSSHVENKRIETRWTSKAVKWNSVQFRVKEIIQTFFRCFHFIDITTSRLQSQHCVCGMAWAYFKSQRNVYINISALACGNFVPKFISMEKANAIRKQHKVATCEFHLVADARWQPTNKNSLAQSDDEKLNGFDVNWCQHISIWFDWRAVCEDCVSLTTQSARNGNSRRFVRKSERKVCLGGRWFMIDVEMGKHENSFCIYEPVACPSSIPFDLIPAIFKTGRRQRRHERNRSPSFLPPKWTHINIQNQEANQPIVCVSAVNSMHSFATM